MQEQTGGLPADNILEAMADKSPRHHVPAPDPEPSEGPASEGQEPESSAAQEDEIPRDP